MVEDNNSAPPTSAQQAASNMMEIAARAQQKAKQLQKLREDKLRTDTLTDPDANGKFVLCDEHQAINKDNLRPWDASLDPMQPEGYHKVLFWERVQIDDDHPLGCWIWTGSRNHGGGGQFSWRDGDIVHNASAVRIVFITMTGMVPINNLKLHQECGTDLCVNWQHTRVKIWQPRAKRVNARGERIDLRNRADRRAEKLARAASTWTRLQALGAKNLGELELEGRTPTVPRDAQGNIIDIGIIGPVSRLVAQNSAQSGMTVTESEEDRKRRERKARNDARQEEIRRRNAGIPNDNPE